MKEYALNTFDSTCTVLIDECFPRDTRVVTAKGNVTLSTLYKLWKTGKEVPLIRCFNENLKKFEYKKMLCAWEKPYDGEMIEIKLSYRVIRCTPNHKILTINGYKEAENLKVNDIVIASYDNNKQTNIVSKGLNDDQLQIVYGSFLGDGSISKTSQGRYRLRIIHGAKQKNYCESKASMFSSNVRYIKENGFSKKEAYSFSTKIFDSEYDFPENKHTCPQWLIDRLDERGLAIWFMDDGSFNNNIVTLSTCSFDLDTNERLIKKLNDMGIDAKLTSYYKKYRNKSY